ncbi:TPA: hypothetical protein DEP94_01765 [Candidatus Nomurabacteria bacterium]|nr:hypothetical protein [Candidatus Nomurabacteria bacterium]
METKIIAIIGAPRSGKTFLVQKLAEKLNYDIILEGANGEFPTFIKDDIKNKTNGIRRTLWFRNKQLTNFLNAVDLQKQGQGSVLDTFWIDYQMYVDMLLDGEDKEIINDLVLIDRRNNAWPDIIIYLKNTEEGTKKFIEIADDRDFDKDGDFYESQIAPLQKKYEEIINLAPPSVKLITIERSTLDFEKEEDLNTIIEKIQNL